MLFPVASCIATHALRANIAAITRGYCSLPAGDITVYTTEASCLLLSTRPDELVQMLCCCAQAALKRSHVAILNAAGRAMALRLGMHVVEFEMMASQFDTASQYLAVPLTLCPYCRSLTSMQQPLVQDARTHSALNTCRTVFTRSPGFCWRL